MDKMTVYGRLPVFAQNWACSLEGMRIERSRYDKVFWDKLREYESLAQKSFDERCAYRDAQLSKMAIHCYRTVPHWRRVFDDAGLTLHPCARSMICKRFPFLPRKK